MDWGIYRQLVAVDNTGAIIVQENIEDATFHALSDLAEKAPDAKYIIPFLNVYADPNNASNLIVDVNGEYHKATLSNQLTGAELYLILGSQQKRRPVILSLIRQMQHKLFATTKLSSNHGNSIKRTAWELHGYSCGKK